MLFPLRYVDEVTSMINTASPILLRLINSQPKGVCLLNILPFSWRHEINHQPFGLLHEKASLKKYCTFLLHLVYFVLHYIQSSSKPIQYMSLHIRRDVPGVCHNWFPQRWEAGLAPDLGSATRLGPQLLVSGSLKEDSQGYCSWYILAKGSKFP